MSSEAIYVYPYVVFAVVYLISTAAFVLNALRVSSALSHARRTVSTGGAAVAERSGAATRATIERSQRLVEYTQLATLLPILYIVGGTLLGSLASDGSGGALGPVWLTFSLAASITAVAFAVLAARSTAQMKESGVIASSNDLTTETLNRIGIRLGVSAGLMLLVAVFTFISLYAVLAGDGAVGSTGPLR